MRSRPPSRCLTFAKTSRSASRSRSASAAGTGRPARRSRDVSAPTRSAQRPIARRAPPARSISPRTFAWIFSYTRGTAGSIVGRTAWSASWTRAASATNATVVPWNAAAWCASRPKLCASGRKRRTTSSAPWSVVLHPDRGRDEVAVGEHAALRRAGRARGVDERGEVVLADRRRGLRDRVRVLAAVRAALLLERGQVGERDDVQERRQLGAHRRRASPAAPRPRRTPSTASEWPRM